MLVDATNQVAQSGDLTAHAEVTAYPCPMCLGALYYAQPERVVYVATGEQEGEHYEDGNHYVTLATFHDEYAKPAAERSLPTVTGSHPDPKAPFRAWAAEHPDA